MSNAPEKYLDPKNLVEALAMSYGVTVTVDRVRDIRRFVETRRGNFFINGDCRPSDLVAWMIKHPDFRRRLVRKNKEASAL